MPCVRRAALALTLVTLSSAHAEMVTMTLPEALDYARAHQPQLASVVAELKARRAEARIPRAAWLPQIGASLQLIYGTANNTTASYLNVPEVDIPRIGATHSVTGVSLSPSPSTLAAASLGQEVFDFGRIAAQAAAADSLLEVARADRDLAALDVELGVEQSFGAVLTAREVLAAASDQQRRAQAHRDLAEARVKSGVRPPIDLTRAAAEVAGARVRRTRAEIGLLASQNALAAAIGAEVLSVDAVAPSGDGEQGSPASVGLAGAIDLARRRNPTLHAALATIRASEAATRAVGRELLPNVSASVGLSGRAGGAAPTSTPPDLPPGGGWAPDVLNWHAGLVLQWNLFDAVVLARRSAQAARTEQARADYALTEQNAVLADERAFLDLDGALRTVPALIEAVTAATANQAQAEARFSAGLGTAIDLADADALLTTAQVELAIGRYTVDRARALLARAIGVSLAETGAPPAPNPKQQGGP
jgi:outer membrane protein